MENDVFAIILGAGQGTRMKSSLPKVMHKIAGLPMVCHLIATTSELHTKDTIVVVGPNMDIITKTVAPCKTVLQEKQQGTGDAVKTTKKFLSGKKGHIFILFGDTPLIKKETLEKMIYQREHENADIVVLGFVPNDPGRYGRLVVENGNLKKIVEFKDASDTEKAITLCNSGVMCVNAEKLFGWIDRLDNNNAAKEYYLTDIVKMATDEGLITKVVEGSEEEMAGANSRSDLAMIENIAQNRLRQKFLDQGITMIDPSSVYFSFDTKMGKDITIEPNVFFAPGCTVEDNVEIKAFCHFEGAYIHKGAIVGPFARLRPEANIGENCHIGDFVEIKKSTIDNGAKVNHLSYIGDAHIGEKTNIGAGTITCNYDGYFKSKTDIGSNAFIGSDTVIVAPCKIGDGAMTAAGSVITKDVENDAMAVGRGRQAAYPGWAKSFREQKQQLKNSK
ncbi:MAG: bifunctional UDP-N-acetylglucosamine diphosphorylase/glucosamine-1-phosphate N-acetyltransferase GlmU [Alphaproteobacteria bacterium]|nr:bifunctional UDP-N-acetylglucosamine diphosphorylase/glucosamine-1-phosphate N-acetyltransferase GlmU [Alphaproteobacteria bacterium]